MTKTRSSEGMACLSGLARKPVALNQKGGSISSGKDKARRRDRRESKAALRKGDY